MVIKMFLSMLVFGFSTFVSAEQNQVDARANILFKTYCISCHNENLRTADLLLDKVDVEHLDQHSAVFERVLPKLRSRAMPPQGLPRPSEEDYEFLIGYLESELDQMAVTNPNPGRTVAHRLNRAEYSNAVRYILGLDFDIEQLLPTDPASRYGFDNMGDVLTLSPVMMETYLSAAKTISGLAIGVSNGKAANKIYLVPENFEQRQRLSDGAPLGTSGGTVIEHYFPVDGEYVIRIYLRQILSGLYAGKTIALREPREMEVRLDGHKLQQFSVDGVNNLDKELSVRVPVKAGMRMVVVTFLRDNFKDEELKNSGTAYGGGVGKVEIEGPYDTQGIAMTPSRQKIFSCQPKSGKDEVKCAKQIISNLARAAYRRPVTDRDVNPLLKLYESGRKSGDFDTGVGLAIQGILISPEFLFRVEQDPANIPSGTVYQISELELASRLSFFLWSSVPDDTLLEFAIQEKLSEPLVLKQQIKRMLNDSRSEALVKNFAAQWLHVRNLDLLSPPDSRVFPDFDYTLQTAFRKEIELLFKDFIDKDRSIVDFLTADYSFLNERLAKHYGIPNVYGSHFRRVSLTDEHRWGLLGKGAILTVTSYATRTSPTLRGKWILETIVGTPVPPPPPDVPSLREDAETRNLSMRERMEMHRTNPVCATCHRLMDPLGLAMENYDAVGAWRTINVDGNPIDASGNLPNGTGFNGPGQLREVLWKDRELFAITFIERLLTYALGRGLEHYDMPTVRMIRDESAPQDYRLSSVVMNIVESQPFQLRRSIQ